MNTLPSSLVVGLGLVTVLLLFYRLGEPQPFLGTGWEDDERLADERARAARRRAVRSAVALATVSWLPLLVLAISQGLAWGDAVQVPFLADIVSWGQFLLAVPILVIGEVWAGRRLGRTIDVIRRSGLVPPDAVDDFEASLGRVERRWSAPATGWVLLVLTAVVTLTSVIWPMEELLVSGELGTNWRAVDGGASAAGLWLVTVSLPVVRFLLLRWTWRLVLWTGLMRHLARLPIRPRPAHPDRAGGLAFLGEAQTGFNPFVLALGVRLSCTIAEAVVHAGADVVAFVPEAATFVCLALVALLAPLAAFAPTMVAARARALLFLTEKGYQGAEDLDRRLKASREGALPVDAISGLADFGPSFDNTRNMLPFPLDLRQVLRIVLAAVVPLLPLVLLEVPLSVVLGTLGRLLV